MSQHSVAFDFDFDNWLELINRSGIYKKSGGTEPPNFTEDPSQNVLASLKQASELMEASRRLRELSVKNRQFAESVRKRGRRVYDLHALG